LQVTDKIKSGDIILCNNACFIDYLFLEMAYSPLFTAVAINRENGKLGLRKLGMLEIMMHAIGIKFPQEVNPAHCYTDLTTLLNSQYTKRPVVIFPEATKTNGKGVLSFPSDITDMIIKTST
jgi:1-acyl-sn-glycerol-3-phosphate acyltransferase